MSTEAADGRSRRRDLPLLSLGSGVVHGLVVTLSWTSIQSHGVGTIPHIYAWVTLGAVTLGAVSAYLFEQYRLLAPVLGLVVAFAASLRSTWVYYDSLGNAAPATVPQSLSVYAVFWPLVLVAVLLVGGLEHLVRGRLIGA